MERYMWAYSTTSSTSSGRENEESYLASRGSLKWAVICWIQRDESITVSSDSLSKMLSAATATSRLIHVWVSRNINKVRINIVSDHFSILPFCQWVCMSSKACCSYISSVSLTLVLVTKGAPLIILLSCRGLLTKSTSLTVGYSSTLCLDRFFNATVAFRRFLFPKQYPNRYPEVKDWAGFNISEQPNTTLYSIHLFK